MKIGRWTSEFEVIENKRRENQSKYDRAVIFIFVGMFLNAVIESVLQDEMGITEYCIVFLIVICIAIIFFNFFKCSWMNYFLKKSESYAKILMSDRMHSITNLAISLGKSEDVIMKDVENIVKKGIYGDCYIDKNTKRLIIE